LLLLLVFFYVAVSLLFFTSTLGLRFETAEKKDRAVEDAIARGAHLSCVRPRKATIFLTLTNDDDG
jgi:hypothetical protein